MSNTSSLPEHPRRSVLLVDDTRRVLDDLERMLRPLQRDCDMTFVDSGAAALDALAERPFDVLVTDLGMPEMSGVELMEHVLQHHPRMIRIALSGEADPSLLGDAVRLAHQFLRKPCEAALLQDTLTQAMRLQELMTNPRLQEITSRVSTLRTVPSLYAALMAEMQAPEPSVLRIADLVASDPAMTAKVLQLVNSAFFGLHARVSDPQRAVQLLGTDTIGTLVLSVQLYSGFPGHPGVRPAEIWQHGMRTARLARHIARHVGLDQSGAHEAFTAGLLHDAGKLVLAEAVPEYAALAADRTQPVVALEREELGTTHAEVGAYLFGLWGLPFGIVEAIAWHHRPMASGISAPGPLVAVHGANVIDHALYPSALGDDTVDDAYLEALGLHDSWERWCQEAVELLAA